MRIRRRVTVGGPDNGAELAAAELAESERLLTASLRDVVAPLRRMRERNNVSEIVARLLGQQGAG